MKKKTIEKWAVISKDGDFWRLGNIGFRKKIGIGDILETAGGMYIYTHKEDAEECRHLHDGIKIVPCQITYNF